MREIGEVLRKVWLSMCIICGKGGFILEQPRLRLVLSGSAGLVDGMAYSCS